MRRGKGAALLRAAAAIAALLFALPAAAQTVEGVVTESRTVQPVAGAQVSLLDAEGVGVASAVTDAAGAFRLQAPAAGEYRLRAERVGLRTTLTRTVPLAAGETLGVEVRMAAEPVVMPPAVADARRRQGIYGRVLDDATGEPVAGATVTLMDMRELRAGRVQSDSSGWFHLRVPAPGGYSLRTEREGYQGSTSRRITVTPDDTVQVELRVSTRSVLLAPLTVVGASQQVVRDHQLAEFEWRREKQPFGRYLGPEEIERIKPFYASDALQQVPMVQVVPLRGSPFDRTVTLPARGRGTSARSRCVPNLYVDGRRTTLSQGLTLDQLVTGRNLAAVEVYASPNGAPGEFPPLDDPFCGVVVIWTRVD
ncbi:MAG TPA: carboxypeptidase-like regulatory domain-containing protein [Longimicrobium sp.]